MSIKQSFALLAVIGLIVGLAAVMDRGGIIQLQTFGATTSSLPEAQTIGAGNPTFDALLQRFDDLAKEKGAIYAFDVLRVAPLPVNADVHLIAHTIGHVLYTEQGIAGMATCTQEFRNGCSHALVVQMLQEQGDGEDVRARIDAACKKAPGGSNAYAMCYHGLGHGVFAFYGFTFPKTVAFCEKTGTAAYHNVQTEECMGGAIMELVSGGGHDREQWLEAQAQYLKPDNPLSPCNTEDIPGFAKSKCYVYMTPHYMEEVGATLESYTDEQMALAMKLCDTLPFGGDRSACIGAFGKDFPGVIAGRDIRKLDVGEYTDAQLREVERMCKLAPTQNDVFSCESYALSTFFWGGEAIPSVSARFCNQLSKPAEKNFCFENLATSIARFVPASQRAAWCDLLDDGYQKKCRTRTL